MNYYLILKSSAKFFFELLILSTIFVPLILIYKSNKKKKKSILIAEKRYYDLKNKLLFYSEVENSINEYLSFSKKNLVTTTYYPDKEYTSFLKTNLNFLKFFYENCPEFFFFRTDWQDPKTLNISLHLCILLKLFEKNIVFYSHSGDPNWINNQVRSWVCKKIFDAHSFLPKVFIKKTKITEPMPEFGIPTSNLHEPSINRQHEIFYIGRLPQDDERYNILNFLKKNKVDIKIFGESTNNFLNDHKFLEIYRSYKITINFPKQVMVKGITSNFAFRGRVSWRRFKWFKSSFRKRFR